MQTLVLNQSYEPVKVVSWQKALQLLTLGKVEIVEEYDHEVRSRYLVFKVPAVVRLLARFRRRQHAVKFSRVNIYGRDGYRCQYCQARKPIDELTYDHVLPRSRGGKTNWTNIVTCCSPCNLKKADRTPSEAHMKLLREPVQPKIAPVVMVAISRTNVPDAWRDYLYWTAPLDQD